MASLPDSKYIQGENNEEAKVSLNLIKPEVLVVSLNRRYTRSVNGVLHIVQLVFSMIGLLLLSISGSNTVDLLHLPLSWHLRIFIFVSVFAILSNAAVLVLNISSLIESFSINWQLFEGLVYGAVSFLYLCSSAMVASATVYYTDSRHSHIAPHTIHTLTAATIVGFVCCILYGCSVVVSLWWERRATNQQFAAHRLAPSRQASQTSDSQPMSAVLS